jgi:hypothetical protein
MLHNLSVNPLLNFAKSHKKNIRILTFLTQMIQKSSRVFNLKTN